MKKKSAKKGYCKCGAPLIPVCEVWLKCAKQMMSAHSDRQNIAELPSSPVKKGSVIVPPLESCELFMRLSRECQCWSDLSTLARLMKQVASRNQRFESAAKYRSLHLRARAEGLSAELPSAKLFSSGWRCA